MYLNCRLVRGTAAFVFAALLSFSAQAQTPKNIFTFTGPPKTGPVSALAMDSSGALYGTTKYGGNSALGQVYKLSASTGGVWTQTLLYVFTGTSGDGAVPLGGVTVGTGSVIYGTTLAGGANNCGTIFELQPPKSGGGWTESILYSFTCGSDGGQPRGGVIIGNGGVLYGTASSNGASVCGDVFSLKPPQSGSSTWTYTVLYSFTGTNGDGCTPFAGLTLGKSEILYGATQFGGSSGNGAVFQLSTPSAGRGWTESVLYSFAGGPNDGANPNSTLALNSSGDLFGTTRNGGASGSGTAFELIPASGSGGGWTEAVMHSFGSGTDGSYPVGVALGSGKFVYGVTTDTGSSTQCAVNGCGTVFELKPPSGSGGTWTEVVLHNFNTQNGDGAYPQGNIVINSTGLIYGTTFQGGGSTACAEGCGMAFELTP